MKQPTPRRLKWKRRLIRAAVVLVALIALIRIAVLILAPVIISAAARGLGLQCQYQRLKLSMLGTNASLWGVTIKSLDGKTEVLTADYAHANLNTFALLRLRLVALRLEADGVEVPLARKADGTIPLLEALAAGQKSKSAPSGQPGTTNFTLPLEIHALRVHKLDAKLKDESLSPPFEDTVRMDLRVSDFGRPGLPARVEFDASSLALFSSASADALADIAATTIKGEGNLSLRGFKAGLLSPYLAAFGISADDRSIDLRGKGKFTLNASPTPGEFQGLASLSDVRITADSAPVASLDSLTIDIAAVSPSLLHLRDVQAANGSLRAERTIEGHTRFAAFAPAPARPSPPPAPPQTNSPTPPVASPAASTPFAWRIDRIGASQLSAIFDDRAIRPRTTLSLLLSKAEAKDLRSDGPPDLTSTFAADITIPGIVGSITARGSATPFQPQPRAAATLALDAIRPDALTPYLRELGIESTIDSASVKFSLNADMQRTAGGPLHSTITIDRATVKDGDAALFDIGPFKLSGLAAGPSGRIDIASFEGAGPEIKITRLTDGRFEVLGLRIAPPKPDPTPTALSDVNPQAASPSPAPAARAPTLSLPPLHLGTFAWKDARLIFEDLATPQDPPIELADARLEITDVNIGPSPSQSGKLRGHFRLTGVINSFHLSGAIESSTSSLRTQLTAQGTGMSLARLAPYLTPLGIEPTLQDGSLSAALELGASRTDTGLRLAAAARDVSLTQSGNSLLSLSEAKIEHADLGASRVAIGPVSVSGFRSAASRDSTGVAAAGVRLLPMPAAEPSELSPLPNPLAILSSLGDFSLESLAVNDARLAWTDSTTKSPVSTEASISLSIGTLALKPGDPPAAPLAVSLKAPGLVQDLAFRGTLAAGPDAIRLEAECRGTGVNTSLPAAYLPAGIHAQLDSGIITFSSALALTRADANAVGAAFALRDFDFRAPNSPDPLAHLISADIDIARLDTLTHDLAIRRLSAQGFSAAATGHADGSVSLLGFHIRSPGPTPQDPAPQDPPPTPASTSPAIAPPTPRPARSAQSLLASSQRPLPLIAIDSLDLSLARLSFTGPAPSQPIALVDASLKSKSPITLLGRNPESNPPASFAIEAAVEPFIRSIQISAQAAPFATEPSLNAAISASGIDATRLTEVLPALAPHMDGSSLNSGSFTSNISATARVQRRGTSRIDWARGAAISLSIDGTEFRQGDTLLAAVKRIRADSVRFDPASGNITAPEVEIDTPSGNAWRDSSGIHIVGLTVKTPGTAPEPPTPETNTPPPAHNAPAATQTPAAAPAAGPEVRIDRLIATGLDFRFEDRAVDPPLTIPFNALDAEVRGLSSAVLHRERPVRFNASIGAGKVALPRASGEGVEEREFFSQCFASGTIAMFPAPQGRAILSLSGLELAALRGIARDAGASIGGGVLDARVALRGQDVNSLLTSIKVVLTDLRYAEPDDGPVKRFMALPMPVNAAIAAIEAPDGTITISPEFSLDQRGLSTSKIIAAAATAAGQVVATAVLSAPAKVVGGVASLLGSDDKSSHWVDEPPITLGYSTGVTVLPSPALASLREIIQLARTRTDIQVSIEHRLGSADRAMSADRANPALPVAAALAEDLRRRRALLIKERESLLSPATAQTLGVSTDTEPRERLRALSQSLADLDDSMDQLYALQAPGANSLKDRRTRNAAWELVDSRIAAVRKEVNALAGSDGSSRIVLGGSRPLPADSEASQLIVRIRRKVDGPTSPEGDARSSGPASSPRTAPDANAPPSPAAPGETPSPRP